MKTDIKVIFFLLLTVGVLSCQTEKFKSTSLDTKGSLLRSSIFLDENSSVRLFYDVAILDSFVFLADYHNDTLIQVYDEQKQKVAYTLRGGGPTEFLTPYFFSDITSASEGIMFVDPNSHSVGRITVEQEFITQKRPHVEGMPISVILSQVKDFVYGVNIDQTRDGMFYIWDRRQKTIKKQVEYYPKLEDNRYDPESLPFLYMPSVCSNEKSNMLAVALLNMNVLHFYNLEGVIEKSYTIGEELILPLKSEFLDFSNDRKHFTSISGTQNYLYCLYSGKHRTHNSSEIFVFDWEGNFHKHYSLDKHVHNIAANPTDEYILGIHENAEGGSTVLKFQLEKE